jgi:hypothetical protein
MTSYLQIQDGGFLLAQDGTKILLQEATEMTDQVEIVLPLTIVQEETTFVATIYNRTRPSMQPSVPTTMHYRVDCLSTKREITDWTSIASPAASKELLITSDENKILDDSFNIETKQLTVKLDSGLATQQIKPIQWKVRNLLGIT